MYACIYLIKTTVGKYYLPVGHVQNTGKIDTTSTHILNITK